MNSSLMFALRRRSPSARSRDKSSIGRSWGGRLNRCCREPRRWPCAGAVRPLSECLESVNSREGRRRVVEHLDNQPFPHYEPAPDAPGMLVRIEADGKRSVGRFVNRQFQEAD